MQAFRLVAVAPAFRVIVTRGGMTESVHLVTACVVDGDGTVTAGSEAGAADAPFFVRSAAKPLQAVPAVVAGVLEALGLDDRHLAVACASHGGSDEQAGLVRDILDAAGLPEAALRCGTAPPLEEAVAVALAARGEVLSPVRHSCSGNHALGLALCVVAGWPTDGYLEPAHPLQAAMRSAVVEAAGLEPSALEEAVDGCGMRAYRMPLHVAARLYGRLASGRLGPPAARVAGAMRRHPLLVHGRSGVDSALMASVPGLVAKIAAEAGLVVGLPDGRGLALKVRDGAGRALGPAGVAALRTGLGIPLDSPPAAAHAVGVARTSTGAEVGEVRAEGALGPA